MNIRSILFCGGNLVSVYAGWLYKKSSIFQDIKRVGLTGKTSGLITLFLLGFKFEELNKLLFSELNEITNNDEFTKTINRIIFSKSNGKIPTLQWLKISTGIIFEYFYFDEKTSSIKVCSIDNDPTMSALDAIYNSVNYPIDQVHPIPYEYFPYDEVYVVIPGTTLDRNFYDIHIKQVKPKSRVKALIVSPEYKIGSSFGSPDTWKIDNINLKIKMAELSFLMLFLYNEGIKKDFIEYEENNITLPEANKQPYYFLNSD